MTRPIPRRRGRGRRSHRRCRYTLFVADFADTDTAWEAYEALKSLEDGATIEIEGVIVVKRDAEGKVEIQKVTDHSTGMASSGALSEVSCSA